MITALFAAAFLFFWGTLTGVNLLLGQIDFPRAGYWHDRAAVVTIVFLFLTVGGAIAQFILNVVWR